MDLMLAQQKWNEEHQDELEDEFIQRTTSKRRKKTSSSNTDFDDDTTHHNQDASNKESNSSALTTLSSSSTDKKKEKSGSSSNDQESPSVSTSSSPSSSPKTGSNHGRMGPKKSSTSKSASKARSRSNSPMTNGVENRSNNSSISIEDETKRTASVEDRSPSTKRRKINSRSEVTPHSESASPEGADEAIGKNDANESDMHTRSRKSGSSSRSNNKRNNTNTNDDNEYNREDSTTPNISSQFVPSPATTTKKTISKRCSDRGHNVRTGSRHSTPGPVTEGTPQPMAPAPPATVRYPSSKMTIHEMTKRAKQLLDYISRVQIDMADRKNKIETQSPSAETTEESAPVINHDHKHIHRSQKDVAMNDESVVFRLPASASSIMHGDSQVCPDLSRSSMESTASSMDGLHEPSSPVDTKVPTNETASSKEMTIKVVPMNPRDTLPLLSTPPLSVHDRHHQHHQRHSSGTPESESTHEPLTPPHQPTESDEQQKPNGEEMTSSSSATSGVAIKADTSVVTSLDLMDKLTGDLIRFQERFGAYS
ncbi:hypothetical protein BGX26_008632 [Mortierella sp. AD094]|nr:hypothetical protein BGX26_008632 [Mortierella sp. AD094]